MTVLKMKALNRRFGSVPENNGVRFLKRCMERINNFPHLIAERVWRKEVGKTGRQRRE